jgi:TolB-like protein
MEKGLSRILAVILHADVVGSTALVRQNETLAHQCIKDSFVRFSKAIETYGGTVHELRGDALVAVFARASDALCAAIAFQNENKTFNASLEDDLHAQLRVGIAMGEVIIADNTITGDGVVLAQRLEQIAKPDGACIQGAAYETVPKRFSFVFENMGERTLKGFDEPVRAYGVSLKVGEPVPPPEPHESNTPTPELPSKPSLAVLPFANMSNDPEQEYFADGISEELITALSHIKQWFVVARNSSFAYKGRNIDIRELAKELGVRYVLEGSVRKAGNRLRITGQLIEAETGTHLWADRFDGDLDDVFALQDKITESVVGAIEPSLRMAEIERSKRMRPENIGAYDLYLKALPNLYAMRPEANEQALSLLHKAIDFDPNYAPALAFLAWGYEQRLHRGWVAYGEDDSGTAVALAHRAIAADRDDAHVMAAAGFVLVMIARDYGQGIQATERALELNPNIAFVSMLVGWSYVYGGDPAEAITCFENAIRVSPADPGAFFFYTGAATGYLFCGQPDKAYDLAKKSARMYSDWDTTYWVLIPALVQLGRTEEAHAAVSKLLKLSPTSTVSRLRELLSLRNPEYLNMTLDGMTIAGLPE